MMDKETMLHIRNRKKFDLAIELAKKTLGNYNLYISLTDRTNPYIRIHGPGLIIGSEYTNTVKKKMINAGFLLCAQSQFERLVQSDGRAVLRQPDKGTPLTMDFHLRAPLDEMLMAQAYPLTATF
jgi:hypothetical protein